MTKVTILIASRSNAGRQLRRWIALMVWLMLVFMQRSKADPPVNSTPSKCGPEEVADERGCLQLPIRTYSPEPVYPESARKKGLEADVVLKLVVGIQGQVTDVELVNCTEKDEGFEAAAIEAVKHWKFKPARLNGRRQAVFFTVNVRFKRRNRKPNSAFQRTHSRGTSRAGHGPRHAARR